MSGMTNWQEFTDEVPEFAARVVTRLLAFPHLTMATIRADGAPRISGTEIRIRDGELWLAGMSGNRRFADLRRDPRVAIHSASTVTGDGLDWDGDAKVSGTVIEVTDPAGRAAFRAQEKRMPPGEFELFRVHPTEVTLLGLNETASAMVIQTWRRGAAVVRFER
jgi:hypothetical protein